MTFRDLTRLSIENLRLKKFRAILTASGIVVAIGAFVSMVSFGAGTQANIEREYEKLGLFTTMQVFPGGSNRGNFKIGKRQNRSDDGEADTVKHPPLDLAAVQKLQNIPGVKLAYPFDPFDITIKLGDSTEHTEAMALPVSAIRTKLYSGISVGRPFADDSSHDVILSRDLVQKLGVANVDSIIGKRISVSVRVSMLDSALVHIVHDTSDNYIKRLKKLRFDSLWRSSHYRRSVLSREANAAAKRFMNGLTEAQLVISDTLTVCGVRESLPGGNVRVQPVIIPFTTAKKFSTKGFSTDPIELVTAFQTGTLFETEEQTAEKSFPRVTLDLDPKVINKTVSDSVKKLGFTPFSFAEQFEEIQKFLYYFDVALGVVGIIALFTASLGIINTMVMSISERRREIGILKSLGADDSDIWKLFLVESGVIGFFGTSGGILFGWSITRIVAAVAAHYMEQEGIPVFDPFALPWWLVAIALTLGVGISVIAGLYPAARAARVDPVTALRNE